MALLKYYKLKKLPKPIGPPSHYIPSSPILTANEELNKATGCKNGDDTEADICIMPTCEPKQMVSIAYGF